MRVLITGGAGFKGCVVAEALQQDGHDVTVLDSMRYGEGPALGLLRRGIRVVRGDVTVPTTVAAMVEGQDAVVHLAGLVGFPLCDREPLVAEAVNVVGTRNVVNAMGPEQLLIYASTGSVYGRVDGVCSETREPAPLTHYGRTKLAGERLALEAGGVSLRFATLHGVSPCMRFDLLLNSFVYRAIHIGWMVLYQSGDRRSFLDVADAARSYCFALRHYHKMSGQAFNVGSAELNVTKGRLARLVQQTFPMRIIEEEVDIDPDQRNYEVSFDKISRLGFDPSVSLEHSIEQVGCAARLGTGEGFWRFQP
jgi:nucleoside-diphosphate-sugar epimerase